MANADPPNVEVRTLVEHFFRHESARLVAALTRKFGVRRWNLVEDVVQGALQRALTAWSHGGIPENPAAWLHRVASRLALDALRRDLRWNPLVVDAAVNRPAPEFPVRADDELQDDLLRMMFVCCDPAVPAESQAALALKTLCGFHDREIARALLITESAVAKRVFRAKEILRGIGLDPSALTASDFPARLPVVQSVLYLLFHEGYSSGIPDRLIREELCEEAVRLACLLAEHPATAGPAASAFLALLLFHAARLEERLDDSGELLTLGEQDRSRWDQRLLGEAFRRFEQAAAGSVVCRYHAEAWIAYEHCRAASLADTDWSAIVRAYDLLLRLAPSPIHELNRAVALSRRDGPIAGLDALAAIDPKRVPTGYYLWHAVQAEFARAIGDVAAARAGFETALSLAPTHAERRFLEKRLREP